MAEFEDNNPFSGSDTRSETSSSAPYADEPAVVAASSPLASQGFAEESNAPDAHDSDGSDDEHSAPQYRQSSRSYSSRVEQLLVENPELIVTIVDAGKSHEGNSRGFIAYTIKIQDLAVRRRYSEFESLRLTLTKLFPTLIVPPIPEKHSMSNYAASPTKAKEDSSIIEHRQRMLAVFLNRCLQMPQIRNNEVFQRFLDPNSSWSEVLNSPPVTTLPKSILRAPPLDPANPTHAHAYLPVPSSSSKLRTDEEGTVAFDEVEANAKEYETVIVGGLEKVNRRIIKRYSDLAGDYSELGARFNAFSLEESGPLANVIEKVGQAVDGSYIAMEALVNTLSSSFGEPLGESAQFAAVVRSVLKYRRHKALQKEMTADSLESKRVSLEALERSEHEAQRINMYLQKDAGNVNENEVGVHQDDGSSGPVPDSASLQTQSTSPSKKKSGLGFKIPGMSKLNHAIHGIIDTDPETTRRSNIGKTREQISHLEEALVAAEEDTRTANESVKEDLDRFQRTKEDDLRHIIGAYIECHLEWARKNLENWQESRTELEKL